MKMNRIEKLAMNNPFRAMAQEWYEAPLLQRLGGRLDNARILEVGCGGGIGTRILLNRFGARHICAIDLDLELIDRARKRLARYIPHQLLLAVGDMTAIQARSASFDAVFDFAAIHHVPDWQIAVAEIRRVLKPGGRFFFEEVTSHALRRWSYRTFLVHPTENRFTAEEFVAELERQGILVAGNFVTRFFGDFVFGVGRRTAA